MCSADTRNVFEHTRARSHVSIHTRPTLISQKQTLETLKCYLKSRTHRAKYTNLRHTLKDFTSISFWEFFAFFCFAVGKIKLQVRRVRVQMWYLALPTDILHCILRRLLYFLKVSGFLFLRVWGSQITSSINTDWLIDWLIDHNLMNTITRKTEPSQKIYRRGLTLQMTSTPNIAT